MMPADSTIRTPERGPDQSTGANDLRFELNDASRLLMEL
jgi:hypothetical protein